MTQNNVSQRDGRMTATDPFGLERFVVAQEPVYSTVIRELTSGAKRSHWMWFVFPQIAGLGHSEAARRYAIGSLVEAAAYAAHPVLGARLIECTEIVLGARPKSATEIFGRPDDLKFHSCMTLFSLIDPHHTFLDQALAVFFDGAPDEPTTGIVDAI